MYTVYHIITVPSQTNAFTTGRLETWTLKKYNTYSSLEEARQVVLDGNIRHSDLLIFADKLCGPERESFYQQFCFDDDKYLAYRRFFLGKPKFSQLKQAIVDQGINVL